MTVAHARALLPSGNVLIAPHRPARDARALVALAHWAVRFTPLVEPDPWPGMEGLCMDITGCLRLFHGQQNMMNLIATSLSALGLQARLACAPTIGCACALARFGPSSPCIVEPADLLNTLHKLPVAALRIDPATVASLSEIGVERVGELLRLPRTQLSQRFGHSLLQAIDHATGRLDHTINPLIPPEPIQAHRLFAGPSTHLQSLLDATQQLINTLTLTLHKQQLGALKLHLTFTRADLPQARLTLQLTHPSRDAKHLWTLLRPKLESLHMGHGIESISLVATRTAPLGHAQTTVWGTPSHPQTPAKQPQTHLDQPLSQLLDHLADRLGHQRLLTAIPRPNHLPEHSFTHRSVTETPSPAPGISSGNPPASAFRRGAISLESARNSPERARNTSENISTPGSIPRSSPESTPELDSEIDPFHAARSPDEPSLLLPAPEPVHLSAPLTDALIPALPVSLFWRNQTLTLITSQGPRRVTPPWWTDSHAPSSARDYFRAQTHDGRWLWLYHEPHAGRWFLHGWWA
jgi:protein ImuB